ncbi:hypothetical protein Hanom_Chr05g00416741 [Helianthus anomalus]
MLVVFFESLADVIPPSHYQVLVVLVQVEEAAMALIICLQLLHQCSPWSASQMGTTINN